MFHSLCHHLATLFERLPADRELGDGVLEGEQLAVDVQERIAELLVIGFKDSGCFGGHRQGRGVNPPPYANRSLWLPSRIRRTSWGVCT